MSNRSAMEVARLMARVAGLQFRVENYLYMDKETMAVAEKAMASAMLGRISLKQEDYDKAVKAHTGIPAKTREYQYGGNELINGINYRCDHLLLMAKRIVCEDVYTNNRTFAAEVWFDVRMIKDYASRIDVSSLLVTQHDNYFYGFPNPYKTNTRRTEKMDAVYFIEEIKPTRRVVKKPKKEARVPRTPRVSKTTAQDLLPLPTPTQLNTPLGERIKNFL